jgi:hypothetical protein
VTRPAGLLVPDELYRRDSLQILEVGDVTFHRMVTQYEVSAPILKAKLDIWELVLDCTHPYFDFLILHSRMTDRNFSTEGPSSQLRM